MVPNVLIVPLPQARLSFGHYFFSFFHLSAFLSEFPLVCQNAGWLSSGMTGAALPICAGDSHFLIGPAWAMLIWFNVYAGRMHATEKLDM
jgi:hypothetical protein